MTIPIAVIKRLYLFSTDFTQAYLQSDENLERKVYIKPCKSSGLPEDKLLLLNKPLHGQAESGDYSNRTL